MSHAVVIVALSEDDIAAAGGDVDSAVSHQMEPFDENGCDEMFEEGSRWDWWVIGGRWTGKLTGYEPLKDRDNYDRCWLCEGTGSRPLSPETMREISAAGHPVIGNGCNGCMGTGWILKSARDWKKLGNIAKRSEIQNAQLSAYAFLRDRKWHERTRMGWFGMPAATECQVKSLQQTGEEYTGRCVFKNEAAGSQIVSWQEDEKEGEDDRWGRLYFPRFIRNLPPEMTLVAVDYHI